MGLYSGIIKERGMKRLLIALTMAVSLASFSLAELRVWTLNNGKTVEAEFVSHIGRTVALKTIKGKLVKVQSDLISADDKVYIELSQPPALEFSFSKKTKPFIYAPLTERFEQNNVPPRSLFYDFSTLIKQTSSNPYTHEMLAEVFVMAVEVDGEKNILIDYRREPFRLTADNRRMVNIQGAEELMLTTYLGPSGYWRGEKFAGYLIVITDARGEIIGHKTTREWWFENLENLRKVPVGKTFDEECNRCWPTRPRVPDY